ncbi:MAG: hypothetical protein HY812_11880 [Planctomycetes bacterium]|nr:hypothetical protein [Planctomycetota bacterium]
MSEQAVSYCPAALARRPGLVLFLLGFLTLFLELCLIRYMAGNVWNLGYFPNLVLLAAFLGMGTGFVCHQFLAARAALRCYALAPALLLGLVLLITLVHPSLPGFERYAGSIGGELYFTSLPRRAPASSILLFVAWFAAPIAVFALISQLTAKAFVCFAPLKAYTLDISGSCCGILAFMAMSWFELPAALWFALLAPLFLAAPVGLAARPRALGAAALLVAALLIHLDDAQLLPRPAGHPARALAGEAAVDVRWSPYQKVEFTHGTRESATVHVNGLWHQCLLGAPEIAGSFYRFVYEERARSADLPPYARVLVIGAGSGNDVACALMHGARAVDAVEIDPAIAEIGRRHHPERPYSDPRVTLTVGDGRAFLTTAAGPYDLIVFALTDSLVKVSPLAQLRLENYVFTSEAMRRAYDLLAEHGTLAFYNYYREPWLLAKLRETALAATGVMPRQINAFETFTILTLERSGAGAPAVAPAAAGETDIATDDWPFPYLRRRGLAPLYGAALALLLAYAGLLLLLVRRGARAGLQAPRPELKLAFALMGAAFLLLETKSVIQFSLLFGTTWLNSSLVLLAVLLLVLAANWTAHALRGGLLLWLTVPALLLSALATFVVPLADLLYLENGLARFLAASLLTFSPVFFANLLFSVAIRSQGAAEHLFGWNLLGASAGGILEYSSMALGYNALALLVALLYAATVLLLRRGGALRAAPA